MIFFPNAKINIGLHVISKRTDGYHDLETVFYPIPLYDVIEIIRVESGSAIPVNSVPVSFGNTTIYFSLTGLSISGDLHQNICIRACELLIDQFPGLPDFQFLLHKNIPTGAGLGGGSADAAFTLLLLNETFKLGLTNLHLEALALQLGSDVPFFIRNTPAYAEKRGEQLETVQLDLSGFSLLLVYPGIHISTQEAFANVNPSSPSGTLKNLINVPVHEWKDRIKNDFEKSLFVQYPALEIIKKELYQLGALYASLSGSGSAVYGIIPSTLKPSHSFPSDYKVWHLPNI